MEGNTCTQCGAAMTEGHTCGTETAAPEAAPAPAAPETPAAPEAPATEGQV